MSDLASIDFLTEMADHKMVIDITVIGHGPVVGSVDTINYTLHLALADRETIYGNGSTLQDAIASAYTKFEIKLNKGN